MDADKLKKLCALFVQAKELIIQAEESDPEFSSFLQPSLEIKSSMDHLIRALSAAHGLVRENEEYIDTNLDKAISHSYRAYFDAADWMSINLRSRIEGALAPFDNVSITAVLPDYYSTIKPSLVEVDGKVAGFRTRKDIGHETDELFGEYKKVIAQLQSDYARIVKCVPAIVEHANRQGRSIWKDRGYGFFVAIILLFLGVVVKKQIETSQQPSTVAPAAAMPAQTSQTGSVSQAAQGTP